MNEYTSEENKELLDTIKNPVKYYRINIWGYGGEAAYMSVDADTYEYWSNRNKENDIDQLHDYMVEAEEEDAFTDVPKEYDFLREDDNEYRSPWYEAPNEIDHQYGVDYSNATISIDEVDSEEYDANIKKEIVASQPLNEWTEENDIECVMDVTEVEESPYMIQFYSAEKGTFFDGIISSNKKFDPKKLKIYTTEYFNGDDTITSITYDGVEIDNSGGDTNGKGYSVHMWHNSNA